MKKVEKKRQKSKKISQKSQKRDWKKIVEHAIMYHVFRFWQEFYATALSVALILAEQYIKREERKK